jgi:hypothetical protein
VIDLRALGTQGVHAMTDLAIVNVAGGTRISLASDTGLLNTITLSGITANQITAANLLFQP